MRLQASQSFIDNRLTDSLPTVCRPRPDRLELARPVGGIEPADAIGGERAIRHHRDDIQVGQIAGHTAHPCIRIARYLRSSPDLAMERDPFGKLGIVREQADYRALWQWHIRDRHVQIAMHYAEQMCVRTGETVTMQERDPPGVGL